jgi:carbonic anhydrase/acetyltransferase-like protein (isoleucine patch superfamily)
MQQRSPHILSYAGIAPAFATPPVHAGAGAAVLGRVTIGRGAWLGALSVVRADGHYVRVGDDFRLGARSTLHINHDIFPCIVGDRVTVGRNACVHACTVGSGVVIGDRAVILDGAVVEDDVVLGDAATVFPNKRLASGFLYEGSPAKPVRALEAGEVARRRQEAARGGDEEPPAARVALGGASSIHSSVFVAGTATVRGRVLAAEGSSIWYSNVLDAGEAAIAIGANTNIQDNTVIRCATGGGVTIGANSTVGHNVTMADCVIGERSLIGIGSTVAEATVVGDGVLLAAAARTTPGQVLEAGWLYGGSPARKLARLDEGKQALTALIVRQYCQYAQDFAALERRAQAAE